MSKKQSTVATSIIKAEYIALTHATKETIWIQRLIAELGRPLQDKIIFGDNQGAIALAYNPEYHARIKHINIQYHFIREKVEDREVELKYYSTEEIVADVLIKHWQKKSTGSSVV